MFQKISFHNTIIKIFILIMAISPSFGVEIPIQAVSDVIIGDINAPINVIEYSSLNCSACAQFHQKVFPVIRKKYIDTGKVCFRFRHFPLDQQAAEIAAIINSAPEFKQFTLIQRIFEQQDSLARSKDVIKFISNMTDISVENCNKIIQDQNLINAVLQKRIDVEKIMDIPATPTFIINGRIINYAVNLEEFEKFLNGDDQTQVNVDKKSQKLL